MACERYVPLGQDSAPTVSLGMTYIGDLWANTTGGRGRDDSSTWNTSRPIGDGSIIGEVTSAALTTA